MKTPAGQNPSSGPIARVEFAPWRNTLAFRLAVIINLTAMSVLAAFGLHDYRRERRFHLDQEIARLREEAKVLRVVANAVPDQPRFQGFVEAYCGQMEKHASPGHHILVVDAERQPWARAHMNAEPALEHEMAAIGDRPYRQFRHRNDDYVVVGLTDTSGRTILVGQSLAPAQRLIRAQGISRAASMAVTAALILAATSFVLWRWARRPIRNLQRGVEAIAAGDFNHRVSSGGIAEFRALADGFNRMANDLGQVERHRQVEMDRARHIQRSLLPARIADIPGATVAARYIPADAVGGDYYDALQYPDGRWLIVVADVCGHGVASALVTALLRAIVQQQVERGNSPAALAATLNKQLKGGVAAAAGGFVTCFLAAYRPADGGLEYISAGHEPALLLRAGGGEETEIQPLESTAMPLGVHADGWASRRAGLAHGDRLIVYTDGLTDGLADVLRVTGTSGDPGSFEELVCSSSPLSPHEQVDHILQRAKRLRDEGGIIDDITLLALRRNDNDRPV